MSRSHNGAINEILETLEYQNLAGLDALVALTGAIVQASRTGLMPPKTLAFVPDIVRVVSSYVDASTDDLDGIDPNHRNAVMPSHPCPPRAGNTQTQEQYT